MGLIDLITAIADAIRSKTGKSDKLTLAEMPSEIESIQTGGDNTDIEDAIVTGELTEYINNRVTTLKEYCFRANTKLTKFSSTSVIKLQGGSVFQGCSNLRECTIPNLVSLDGSYLFSSTPLQELRFPKVKSALGSNCFSGCTSLALLEVGEITSFSSNGFTNCTSLVAFILRNNTISPLKSTSILANTPIENGTGYIYVPRAMLSDEDATKDYRRATNWITYAEQFRAIEDYPEICGGVAE